MRQTRLGVGISLTLLFILNGVQVLAQTGGGAVRGTITLAEGGTALHNVIVTIVQLRRSVETDENGAYEF